MATEIEHKYLVINDSYMQGYSQRKYLRQGYLTTQPACTLRVRITDTQSYITIKGENKGASRAEYEFEIDTATAQSMLDTMCHTPIIEKHRYLYEYKGHRWEIDHFYGENEGLVVAEIELSDENETYELPPFVGRNVTGIARYYNSCLSQRPYTTWDDEEK